jgi:hypothetical protein
MKGEIFVHLVVAAVLCASSCQCSLDSGSSRSRRSKFTEAEDQRIREAIGVYGTAWSLVAQAVGGDRIARQCRARWHNYLTPQKSPFTSVEDALLIYLVGIVGRHWGDIAKQFANRNASELRWRFIKITKHTPGAMRAPGQERPLSQVLQRTSDSDSPGVVELSRSQDPFFDLSDF